MKNLIYIFLALLVAPGYIAPCSSQGFHYEGPGNDNYLFAIGWSKDGKRLAYGMFNNYESAISDERISSISIIIHDLVKDSLIFHTADVSSSGNPDYASTAKQAWLRFDKGSNLNGWLRKFGIETASSNAVLFDGTQPGNTITTDNDLLTVDIRVSENPGGYANKFEIRVNSRNLGEKTVASDEMPAYRSWVTMNGYILNPDRSRAAIILSLHGGAEMDSEYFIVGCHLKAGFKMTEK
ncbi:MAG TPA: hypothetical protein VI583_07845 [Cyclobacteriaceae bacterium]|nr:hypothetical protein [Cyclobacteriaceae bacterium]